MGKTESGIEPCYLIDDKAEGRWIVYKVDLDTMSILSKHTVVSGRCDCEGWKHNMKCRHLQMVFSLYPVLDRKTARKAAAEVIASWQDKFSRLVFEDYLFDGPEENGVRAIKLRAVGTPIGFEDKVYKRLFAVRRGVFIEVTIE